MSHYENFMQFMTTDNRLEPQSKKYLSKTECAMCSEEFFEDPTGMFIMSESCKDPRTDHRSYFPICQLVCKCCQTKLEDRMFDGKDSNLSKFDIPSWSRVRMFFAYCDVRPSAVCSIEDPNEVEDVLDYIRDNTDSWEEYDEISGGDLIEEFENENQ